LSNEEKTNDCENFEKGMIYMKILKKRGGSREKGGGGNEIHFSALGYNFKLQRMYSSRIHASYVLSLELF
jgi:hypothetical protein